MINILKKKHQGITVLLLVITLLLISTLMILFAAQYSALQQKITANFYQNQQAFQAAEAGMEASIPYFQTNSAAITATNRKGFLRPYQNSSTQNVALNNGSQYTFVYSNPIANNYTLINITATGTSANGSSSRTLTRQLQSYATGTPAPTTSIQTQDRITLNNSATINNTQTNANINAGGNLDINSSAKTTTSGGTSSTASNNGSDVQENNSALSSLSSNAFFQSVFGTNKTTVQNNASYTYTNFSNTNYSASLNGVTGSIIWINQQSGTATLNGSTIIGSLASPVILVVNGNLQLEGSLTFYGLAFILNPTNDTLIKNNVIINGAIASTGDIVFSNNAILNYNSSVLNALPSSGAGSAWGEVPASWKDF